MEIIQADPSPSPETPAGQTRLPAPPAWLLRIFWQGKIGPAFWTVSGIFSVALNVILIAVLFILARQLFTLKDLVSSQLVGGLYSNFVKMDQAHIRTTITVSDTIRVVDSIPVVFNLPLSQSTEVKLVENTPVNNATIFLNGAAVPLDLVLRKGTRLNIKLDLTVPVSQTVPVVLNVPVALDVPVDIPLNQTELHEPFTGLQSVLSPYDTLLASLPNSWEQTPACSPWLEWACNWLTGKNK